MKLYEYCFSVRHIIKRNIPGSAKKKLIFIFYLSYKCMYVHRHVCLKITQTMYATINHRIRWRKL